MARAEILLDPLGVPHQWEFRRRGARLSSQCHPIPRLRSGVVPGQQIYAFLIFVRECFTVGRGGDASRNRLRIRWPMRFFVVDHQDGYHSDGCGNADDNCNGLTHTKAAARNIARTGIAMGPQT